MVYGVTMVSSICVEADPWITQGNYCFRQLINMCRNMIINSAVVESSNLFWLLSSTCHPQKLLFVSVIFILLHVPLLECSAEKLVVTEELW